MRDLGKVRVLIVEDYRLVRLGLKSALADFPNIDVVGEAVSGEQGVQRTQHIRPDVVLMDLGLPGMDGIQATREIKAFDPDIKVIILTSHDSDDEVLASLSAGANGFCLKEIEIDQLVNVIQTIHQGGAWLDPQIARVALAVFTKAEPQTVPDAQKDYRLSTRERKVLEEIVEGRSNSEIAATLGVSTHTIKSIVSSLLEKLSVTDRIQAAVKAVREKLVLH